MPGQKLRTVVSRLRVGVGRFQIPICPRPQPLQAAFDLKSVCRVPEAPQTAPEPAKCAGPVALTRTKRVEHLVAKQPKDIFFGQRPPPRAQSGSRPRSGSGRSPPGGASYGREASAASSHCKALGFKFLRAFKVFKTFYPFSVPYYLIFSMTYDAITRRFYTHNQTFLHP